MPRSNFPSDKQDQFMLRLPNGMRDELKAAAGKNNRSMNAEIVARLEASFRLQSNLLGEVSVPPLKQQDDIEQLTHEVRALIEEFRRDSSRNK